MRPLFRRGLPGDSQVRGVIRAPSFRRRMPGWFKANGGGRQRLTCSTRRLRIPIRRHGVVHPGPVMRTVLPNLIKKVRKEWDFLELCRPVEGQTQILLEIDGVAVTEA